jgi:hypothetical protein
VNVFEYALFREAGKRMTPDERQIAMELAEAAEEGEDGAADALRAMMYQVLFHERRPEPPEPAPMAHRALE